MAKLSYPTSTMQLSRDHHDTTNMISTNDNDHHQEQQQDQQDASQLQVLLQVSRMRRRVQRQLLLQIDQEQQQLQLQQNNASSQRSLNDVSSKIKKSRIGMTIDIPHSCTRNVSEEDLQLDDSDTDSVSLSSSDSIDS